METLTHSVAAPARQSPASAVAASPFLDRRPLFVRAEDSVAGALSAVLERHAWGAAVLDSEGRYLGMCTLRSLGDLALAVSMESTKLPPSLDYHREDVAALAARLATKGDMVARDAIDRAVPVLRGAQSLPQALASIVRQPPVAAVTDDNDALLGIITLERVLRALHARTGFAAHHPA